MELKRTVALDEYGFTPAPSSPILAEFAPTLPPVIEKRSLQMKLLKMIVLLTSMIGSVAVADERIASPAEEITTASGLRYIDDAVGEGEPAKAGDTVSVHYSGWIQNPDGSKWLRFDTSREIGRPLEFRLGRRQVIAGWEEGISGMRLGGKRTLFVPSALAYGKRGLGKIVLPNQNLIFEVELVGLKAK